MSHRGVCLVTAPYASGNPIFCKVADLSKIVCTQHSVDTMPKDPQTPRYAVRRTHRTYSPQFKAELVAACQQPGTSIAALALQQGINANLLHRWLKEYRQGLHRLDDPVATVLHQMQPPTFIPLEWGTPPPSASESPAKVSTTPASDIRIECQRPGLSVTVCWPLSAATECAQMLRALLGRAVHDPN